MIQLILIVFNDLFDHKWVYGELRSLVVRSEDHPPAADGWEGVADIATHLPLPHFFFSCLPNYETFILFLLTGTCCYIYIYIYNYVSIFLVYEINGSLHEN